MPETIELLQEYLVNYYTKEEVQYRLPPGVKLEDFWEELVRLRKGRGEFLPFRDQQKHPFWFVLTPALQKTLHQIDSRGKDSLYQVVKTEIQEELVQEALIEEAMFSSMIEGAFSTIARARELIVGGKRPRDLNDQMVANNARVMRFVLEQRQAICSAELIHTLQRLATEKTLERPEDTGRFRDGPVYIYDGTGRLVYSAPPAETVPETMKAFIEWINGDERRPFIHPILCAAIIHTYFVYVHPYVDGNGRTARSLFYWYLLKHGYDFFKFFSISSIIQETRAAYYKSLEDLEAYEGDLTYPLLYLAKAADRAIHVVLQRIMERHRRDLVFGAIREKGMVVNERQAAFLRRLTVAKEKRGTIAKYQQDFRVVYETARQDLMQLEQVGILAKRKQGRQFVYTINPGFLTR